MDNIIPPKTINDTHETYMQNFVNILVETTQLSSTFENLEEDTRTLFKKIIDGCRQPMLVAARNRHATAQIFIYLIAEEGKRDHHEHKGQNKKIYDLLFPSGHVKEALDKFGIKPVYEQIVDHLAPLTVEHKIYEVYKSNAIEINNHTQDFVMDVLADESENDSTPEDLPSLDDRLHEYVEGVKKLEPVRRYIGVITVSWAKQLNKV